MPICTFTFEDRRLGWKVQKFDLDRFNLLVGVSGAGKTRILAALQAVCHAAAGLDIRRFESKWEVEVEVSTTRYRWTAETAAPLAGESPAENRWSLHPSMHDESSALRQPTLQYTFEELQQDGTVIVSRREGRVLVDGKEAPQLKESESLLSLLQKDERIRPLVQALKGVTLSHASADHLVAPVDPRQLERMRARYADLAQLKSGHSLPFVLRAWILQECHPHHFSQISQQFSQIFPSVTGLKVALEDELRAESERPSSGYLPMQFMTLAISERGVPGHIRFEACSSGMRRTLVHLLEMALCPEGTVVLIDEYENSLGVNCLGLVTDHLLRHSQSVQFILTSHHPYVIENIPRDHWRVVTRRGGEVRVLRAQNFPELNTRSRQGAFTQLLALLEREQEQEQEREA